MDTAPAAVFALLDDCHATPGRPCSRLYTGFVREHRCSDPATLEAVWAAARADQRDGLHALLLADYEWGAKLLRAGHAGLREGEGEASSLRLLMFRSLERLSADQAGAWLAAQDHGRPEPSPAALGELAASVRRDEFREAIAAVHEAIRAGETYQINYTYRLDGRVQAEPAALYRRLRARQPVAYGAFIALPPDGSGRQRHVLSCSPELFLRHRAGRLQAMPMKGTAARQPVPEGDSESARLLSLDVKNRAENLMIVDLLRNDLGRIARTGSVRVPALFAVESYRTVLQMTSTVEAELRPGLDLPEVLRATFPCGSITGAPKHHTMELIATLESTPRGLYCGAIGWIDAPAADAPVTCGDFCLSVAIRTIDLGAAAADGARPMRLGVGAGIVLDSIAEDEFDECALKARFVTGLTPSGAAAASAGSATSVPVLGHRHARPPAPPTGLWPLDDMACGWAPEPAAA
ncbi:para-aminobenzoate synthetase/4-amino-4-deoxychorismate lyase [Sphaerotilus hippei]|uniref:Para-aminobenzoate synthetase/4-amino-4-deoxychorismate lyase n=1 Tax=Sphaerotilus hippei TaxID=744406 RepID=A0A318GU88_9BURK|nr:para-aminobenzoate synthetase/4-amino-4-deoxychorismate lyase [Sphaerotilus hippei]